MTATEISNYLFSKTQPHGFMAVSYIEPVNMDATVVTLWRSNDERPLIVTVSGLEQVQCRDDGELRALLDRRVESALGEEATA